MATDYSALSAMMEPQIHRNPKREVFDPHYLEAIVRGMATVPGRWALIRARIHEWPIEMFRLDIHRAQTHDSCRRTIELERLHGNGPDVASEATFHTERNAAGAEEMLLLDQSRTTDDGEPAYATAAAYREMLDIGTVDDLSHLYPLWEHDFAIAVLVCKRDPASFAAFDLAVQACIGEHSASVHAELTGVERRCPPPAIRPPPALGSRPTELKQEDLWRHCDACDGTGWIKTLGIGSMPGELTNSESPCKKCGGQTFQFTPSGEVLLSFFQKLQRASLLA